MTEKNPTVSVVIPTYNRAYIINQTIQSVLAQTYPDFELILVDDGSRDNTQEVVNKFNDSRIRYIQHERNAGVSAARNTGIEAARGEYIAFLDSDDEWLPEKLEKQLKLFQQSEPQVGAIYTWLCFINEHNEVKRVRNPEHRGFLGENLLYANLLGTPSTMIVKRECFDKGVRFDSRLRCSEDWDLYLKLAQHYEFEVVPEVLVQYRDYHHKANRATTNRRATTNSQVVIEGHLIFLKRHHQNIKQSYKKLGSFSAQKKAGYFFDLGRRLICHGQIIFHREALNVGTQYLALAFLAYPLSFRFLLHYIASLIGGDTYAKMNQAEHRIRKLASPFFLRLNSSR